MVQDAPIPTFNSPEHVVDSPVHFQVETGFGCAVISTTYRVNSMNLHSESAIFGKGEHRRIPRFFGITALFIVCITATNVAPVHAMDLATPNDVASDDRTPDPRPEPTLLTPAAIVDPSFQLTQQAFLPAAPPEPAETPGKSEWPNISEPGPDMGDFPNSSFTLPKGRMYFEMAPLTFVSPDRFTPAAYVLPFLFRYGITDDVEFRLLGNGATIIAGDKGTSGFSPLILDMKIHLWDGKKECFIPASSLEVAIQTNMASPVFRGGVQPALNMNFDLKITEKTNIEWTIGYAATQDAVDVRTGERFIPRHGFISDFQKANLNVNLFSVQWALEYDVTEKLQVFAHGYYNGSVFLQQGAGVVAGVGLFWKASNRLTWYGSCNAGLDNNVAPLSTQIGFALAI